MDKSSKRLSIVILSLLVLSGCAGRAKMAKSHAPVLPSTPDVDVTHTADADIDHPKEDSPTVTQPASKPDVDAKLVDLNRMLAHGNKEEKLKAIDELGKMAGLQSFGAIMSLNAATHSDDDDICFAAATKLLKTDLSLNRDRALLELMRRSERYRLGAAAALAEVGPTYDGVLPLLCERLKDQKEEERVLAARALAKSGLHGIVALPELLNALLDESPRVRREALLAIGAIRPKPRLTRFLDRVAEGTDRAAIHEMCNVARAPHGDGVDLAPALLYAMQLPDAATRLDAAWALRRVTQPIWLEWQQRDQPATTDAPEAQALPSAKVPIEDTYLSDFNRNPKFIVSIREMAMATVRQTRPQTEDATAILIDIASDDDDNGNADSPLMLEAMQAIASGGDASLRELTNEMNSSERRAVPAAWGLAAISHNVPQAIDVLRQVTTATTDEEHAALRAAASDALQVAGSDLPPAACGLAGMISADRPTRIRLDALQALSGFGPAAHAIVPAVRRLMKDADEEILIEAAWTLSRIDPKSDDTVDVVLNLRGQAAVPARRARVIDSMLQLDPPKPEQWLIPAITRLLDDPDNELRRRLLVRLAHFGPSARGAGERVARIVDNRSAELRSEAALTLIAIGADDSAVAAAFVAAVRRGDANAQNTLLKRVRDTKGARDRAQAKLRTIAESDPDQGQRSLAHEAVRSLE